MCIEIKKTDVLHVAFAHADAVLHHTFLVLAPSNSVCPFLHVRIRIPASQSSRGFCFTKIQLGAFLNRSSDGALCKFM